MPVSPPTWLEGEEGGRVAAGLLRPLPSSLGVSKEVLVWAPQVQSAWGAPGPCPGPSCSLWPVRGQVQMEVSASPLWPAGPLVLAGSPLPVRLSESFADLARPLVDGQDQPPPPHAHPCCGPGRWKAGSAGCAESGFPSGPQQ